MTAPAKPLPPHGTADPAPVRHHIRNLMNAGTGWRIVADLAGVPRSQVLRILYRNPIEIDAAIADRILATETGTPRPARRTKAKTDATGTRRRIRALHHDGYDTDHIGDAIGEWPQTVRSWLRCTHIEFRHAQAVADLYEAWSGIAAEANGVDPEAAGRARALARHRRWAQAGAWSDEIDDPDAVATPWYGVRRAADLYADSEELLTQGESIDSICKRLDVTPCNLKRARERVKARAKREQVAA